MAIATKRTRQVLQPPQYKTIDDGVDLKLSKEEALTLKWILIHIGGTEADTARGYAQQISNALSGAGVHFQMPDMTGVLEGNIYFREGSKDLIRKLVEEAGQQDVQPNKAAGQQAQQIWGAAGLVSPSLSFGSVLGLGNQKSYY